MLIYCEHFKQDLLSNRCSKYWINTLTNNIWETIQLPVLVLWLGLLTVSTFQKIFNNSVNENLVGPFWLIYSTGWPHCNIWLLAIKKVFIKWRMLPACLMPHLLGMGRPGLEDRISVQLLETFSGWRVMGPRLGDCQLQIGTCQGHLPPASAEMDACAAAVADSQYALKTVQGESEALCAPEKLVGQVFR